VLGAYGKALADAGRLKEASTVLANAHTPERPNWSILSAQGSVADQLGDHKQAQNYYKAAIRMRPDEPSVMSNLGLSYALNKQLPQAEETLRDAANNPKADMRIRQNLALVLALRALARTEQPGLIALGRRGSVDALDLFYIKVNPCRPHAFKKFENLRRRRKRLSCEDRDGRRPLPGP